MEVLGAGFSFTEGPRWHDGALWFSDFYQHRVVRWDGATFETVCEVAGQPSGLGFTPDGDLLVVSMSDKRLVCLRDGQLETVAELGQYFDGLANDMWVDAAGRAYIGNDGSLDPLEPTVIVRCDPDGTVSVAARDLITPNGIVVTPDGRRLIAAESFAGRISVWEVSADGTLHDHRIWACFGTYTVPASLAAARRRVLMIPDGITLNANGELWVADAAGSGVWCIAEGGRLVDHVDTSPYTAYSVALGGTDGRDLFIAAGPELDEIRKDGRAQAAILRERVEAPAPGYQ